MELEKWECNKCGSPCRVEIEFDGKGPAGDDERFRGRCVSGTYDYPEERIPDWVRVESTKESPVSAQQMQSVVDLATSYRDTFEGDTGRNERAWIAVGDFIEWLQERQVLVEKGNCEK